MIAALRRQDGLGLPLAMGVLTIVLLLAATAAGVAERALRSAETDRDSKPALAAADAGIQQAAWRLSTSPTVADTACLLSDAGAAAVVGGECPTPTAQTTLGNGAAYRFVVTPILPAGSTCAGASVVAGSFVRCATSTGTVDGQARRVQASLDMTPIPGFSPVGIVGKTEVSLNNSIELGTCAGDPPGLLGSNGTIYLNNSIKLRDGICGTLRDWKLSYPPGTTVTVGNSVEPNPPLVEPRTTPWELPPINWPATNDNASIASASGVSWNASTRVLDLTGTLTLQAGTYVFCSVNMPNGGKIELASGAAVRIYIDSPERSGSTCAAGTGYLRAHNSNGINWPGGDVKDAGPAAAATKLHLYAYGNSALETTTPTLCDDDQAWGAIIFCRSVAMAGNIYAPGSRVYLGNSVMFVGAIAANRVYLNNSVKFRLPPGMTSGITTSGDYGQTDWTECTRTPPNSADPESGCA